MIRWIGGKLNTWLDGEFDRWIVRWMDGRMDG